MDSQIKQYDEIVGKIMQNIINQSSYTNNKIVLWDFQTDCPIDRLYYNVACIVADLYGSQIYVQMPLFSYLKFKHKRRKRKNLHWISRSAKWLDADGKTSVYIIMDFVREYFNVDAKIFEDINNEYYGWID